MYPGYLWRAWRHVVKRRGHADIHVVTSNPFLLPALVRRFCGSSGRTVFLLYDLYPDVLVLAGKIRPGGIVERMLAGLTRYAIRNCDAMVYLGEKLRRHAEARYGPSRRSWVIPVGAEVAPFSEQSPPKSGAVDVMYLGAMGRVHDLETLLGCWRRGTIPGIRWRFHSFGAGYELLKRKAAQLPGSGGVQFGGPLADAEWMEAMLDAPVALVTLALGAENVAMPSRTYSALAFGQAILAVCALDSDLSDLVHKHDCGWVVRPGDEDTFLAVCKELVEKPERLQTMRSNALHAARTHYDMDVLAGNWHGLFDALSAAPTGAKPPLGPRIGFNAA
jgi:glycosyltransferase involved in cell wall biosynthesis